VKILTYLRYFRENIRKLDFLSIIHAIRYLYRKKSNIKNRTVRSRYGKYFCRKNTNDFLFANYAYEWPVKKFVNSYYKNYAVFFDIGACIGSYSIIMGKRGMDCYAFEAIPDNHIVLKKNIFINKLEKKIHSYCFALGEKDSWAKFYFNPVNTGASHIVHNTENYESLIPVKVQKLDDVEELKNIPADVPLMMKIDVEGMENEVIRGAESFIRAHEELLLIMEKKHSGEENIKKTLLQIDNFDILELDEFNMAAIKTKR